MARPVRMPPLGTTSDELRIVEWLKAVGDEVALGEALLAVETDKATLEVEAAAAGTLLEIVHGAGAVVDVGEVLAFVGRPGEEPPASPVDDLTDAAAEPSPAEPGLGDASAASAPAPTTAEGRGAAAAAVGFRVLASPAVRRLAAECGVDLTRVRGSGPGGRIEKADVLAVLEAPAARREHAASPGAQPDAASGQAGDLVTARRQALARRLVRAAGIPQFSVGVTVDMTRAASVLERERAGGVTGLTGLTYTHLLLRALATALREHPGMNVLWVDDGPRRRRLERADVGLAVAGEDALLVVTIPEPDRLPLAALVEQTECASAEARAGRISERFGGSTAVTLSNLGMAGIDRFTAVIDPEQTAILAAGAVVERPAPVAGGVGLVLQLELTLTADHRVVDGMAAGRFLAGVRDVLEAGEFGAGDGTVRDAGDADGHDPAAGAP